MTENLFYFLEQHLLSSWRQQTSYRVVLLRSTCFSLPASFHVDTRWLHLLGTAVWGAPLEIDYLGLLKGSEWYMMVPLTPCHVLYDTCVESWWTSFPSRVLLVFVFRLVVTGDLILLYSCKYENPEWSRMVIPVKDIIPMKGIIPVKG